MRRFQYCTAFVDSEYLPRLEDILSIMDWAVVFLLWKRNGRGDKIVRSLVDRLCREKAMMVLLNTVLLSRWVIVSVESNRIGLKLRQTGLTCKTWNPWERLEYTQFHVCWRWQLSRGITCVVSFNSYIVPLKEKARKP